MWKEEGGKIESVSRTPTTTVRDMDELEGGGEFDEDGNAFLTENAMRNNCSSETRDSRKKWFFLFFVLQNAHDSRKIAAMLIRGGFLFSKILVPNIGETVGCAQEKLWKRRGSDD